MNVRLYLLNSPLLALLRNWDIMPSLRFTTWRERNLNTIQIIYIYICVCVCMCVYVYMYVWVCLCVCVFICECVYVWVCVCVCFKINRLKKRFIYFSYYLFPSNIHVFFQLIAFVREQLVIYKVFFTWAWVKTIWMGHSVRLELTSVGLLVECFVSVCIEVTVLC